MRLKFKTNIRMIRKTVAGFSIAGLLILLYTLFSDSNNLTSAVDRFCSHLCHQKIPLISPENYKGISGRIFQLPGIHILCVRCWGIYTALLLTLSAASILDYTGRMRNSLIFLILSLSLLGIQRFLLFQDSLFLKFITGLLTGSSIALNFYTGINYLTRRTV